MYQPNATCGSLQDFDPNKLIIKRHLRDNGEIWTQTIECWDQGIFIDFHRWMIVLWFCKTNNIKIKKFSSWNLCQCCLQLNFKSSWPFFKSWRLWEWTTDAVTIRHLYYRKQEGPSKGLPFKGRKLNQYNWHTQLLQIIFKTWIYTHLKGSVTMFINL